MPYSSNSDLPENVRSRFSDHCQSVWRHVWNSVYEDTGDESRAFASANSKAQKCEGSKAMSDIYTTAIEPRFKIFAPMLKASLDGDGKRRLHGIASSTIKDRHGDSMSLSALSDMERSASNNLTIFLNHEYKVPEDVAGYVERAQIRSHPHDPDIHDLVLDIVVNESNPRAINAWDAIQNGTQLGLSIGAMIPDGGATRDRKSGAYQIDHVELLETSLVGVPANPRSWVEYAVKSLNKEIVEAEPEEDFEPEGVEIETEQAPEEEIEGEEEVKAPVGCASCGRTDGSHDPSVEHRVYSLETNTTNTSNGNYVITTEPDISDATVSISTPYAEINIDTGNRGGKTPAGDSSQDAPESTPETEDEDKAAETSPWAGLLPVQSGLIEEDVQMALQILEPTVVASLHSSSELLKAMAREHIELKAALARRNDEYEALEEMTKQVITNTAEILDKLSNTPVGRRTVIREANEQFASLKAVYTDDFLAILKRS